jgi:Flp pilus assembly protein TadG
VWWRRRKRGSEGGAVIVEAAIVLPVLFALVFGAIEYGLLFKDDLTGSNVVRAGGRVLSAQANVAAADQAGLQAMLPAAAALDGGLGSVTRIVVYYATCASPDFTAARPCDGRPPIRNLSEMAGAGNCTTRGSTAGLAKRCNVYAGSELTQGNVDLAGNFGCGSAAYDRDWCPSTRVVSQTTGTDYIGVHVEYTHQWATGFFGSKRHMTDDVVFRIEPQEA